MYIGLKMHFGYHLQGRQFTTTKDDEFHPREN